MNIQERNDECVEANPSGFSFTYYGWKLTTPPPAMTGIEKFGQTPSDLIPLKSTSFQSIPLQTVRPAAPKQTNFSTTTVPTGPSFWSVNEIDSLSVLLVTPYQSNLTLTIDAFGNGTLPVTINGLPAGSITVNSESASTVDLQIDNVALQPLKGAVYNLQENSNNIVIGGGGTTGAACINSVSVKSSPLDVTAQAQWIACCNGVLPGTVSHTVDYSVTSGTDATNTQSQSITKSLNIGAHVSGDNILGFLGLGLTCSLDVSETDSSDEGITVSKSDTKDDNYTFSPVARMGYQIWQLALVFTVTDNTQSPPVSHEITQNLGLGSNGPIIINTYPKG